MPSNRIELDQPTVIVRDGHTIIRIPMKLRRMGGRKKIIVPDALDGSGPNILPVQKPLAIAVARGHRWRDLLEAGKYDSVTVLANVVGADPSYIRRHIRMTFLSPRLIEAILNGEEPNGLSLEQLGKKLSVEWNEQNVLLTTSAH